MFRAIYVDHETGLLEVTKRFLEKDPRISEVLITDSPEEALELALSGKADVMVSDYEMPRMDGLELLKAMRSNECDIPFILFTGRGRESVAIDAIDNGADFYIQKGGDPRSQFVELVHKMNIAYEKWSQKRELETFSDIVRSMDTAIVAIHIDEDDIWSSNVQSLNRAANRMFPHIDLDMYPTLREVSQGSLSAVFEENISELSKVYMTGNPHYFEELVLNEDPLLVCNLRIIRLPSKMIGVLADDITTRWSSKKDKMEAERRTVNQRKAALELITDDAVAKADTPSAFPRIAEIVCEGLDVRRAGVWLIDDMTGKMRCVSMFPNSEDHPQSQREGDVGGIAPYIKHIRRDNVLKVDDAFNDIRCACMKYNYLLDEDVRSFLDVGINLDGRLRGIICAEVLGTPRKWHEDEESFLTNVSARVSQMLAVMDREEIRQELDHSHHLLSYIVDNSFASIAVHDNELNYLYVSKSYIEQYDLHGQELIGRHHYEVFPDLPQKWRDVHQRVLKGAEESADIDMFERADGTKHWTRWECLPWYKSDGSIGGLIVYTEIIDKWLSEQERLRESENLFTLITDNLWDNVTIMDLDFKIKYVSKNIDKLRGYTAEESINQSLFEILTPESFEYAKGVLQEAMQAEMRGEIKPDDVLTFEVEQYHKEGHVVNVEVRAGFIRDKESRPEGILTLSRDVTQSKDIQKSLMRSVERQQTILAASGCGAWEVRLDTARLWRSPEYYTMLGYEPFKEYDPDSPGPDGHWLNLIHPEDRDDALRYSEEYVKSGSLEMYENNYRMLKADGSWAHIKSRGRRLHDDEGMPTPIFYGIHIDVSHEAEIQRNLEESHLHLEDIINNLPDPTMVISKEGEILYWNKALEALTGRRSEEMVGKGDHEYAIPFYGQRRPILANLALEMDSEWESVYPKVVRQNDTLTTDDVPVVMDGKMRYLWAMARPIYDIDGNAIGAIESVRDITHKRISREALIRVNRQLTLMTSLTRHDVLNQTMALSGFLALMKDTPDMCDDEHIDRLISIADKIAEQIRFTTIYDEIGSKDPVWHRLEDIVPPRTDFGDILFECQAQGVQVFGDPMLLKVFSNLLDNSLRHGERVSSIRLSHILDENGLTIVWEDDGVGVPEGEKAEIFERGRGKNTGFGLYISRDILSITGMSIEENGASGKGARFEIHVPTGAFRFQDDKS